VKLWSEWLYGPHSKDFTVSQFRKTAWGGGVEAGNREQGSEKQGAREQGSRKTAGLAELAVLVELVEDGALLTFWTISPSHGMPYLHI
jgi:hypothetical protein